MTSARESIGFLREVVAEYELGALVPLADACSALAQLDSPLDVAVVGQFKSGKSSLLNAIVGAPLLPVGATPVTAVITRVSGGNLSATVTRLDGSVLTVEPSQVADYVSEAGNPGNRERVARVDVLTPQLEALPGLRLVDTPGLGSVFEHNTKATRDWLPSVAVALVVVSSERPLSDEDRGLIRELVRLAPRVVVVLSKIDLVLPEQRGDVQSFLDQQLVLSLGHRLSILPFSIREEPDRYVSDLKREVFAPLCTNAESERLSVLTLKLRTLAEGVRAYLTTALAAAEKAEGERSALRASVLDESVSEPLARDELRLAAQRVAGSSRSVFERAFLAHIPELLSRTTTDLDSTMRSWSENLVRQVAHYESWVSERLIEELARLSADGEPVADDLATDAETRFRRIAEALRDRLAHNLSRTTGVILPAVAWQPVRARVAVAPVAIGRTLDTQWELLSWAIPMTVFGGVFRRHCIRRLGWEVEKNLTRLAGAWADATNAAISELERQAAKWIDDELTTLERSLSHPESSSGEIRQILCRLQEIDGQQTNEVQGLRL